MALQLKFQVDDRATPEIKNLQTQLNQLKPSISGAENSMLGLNKSLLGLAAGYISVNTAISGSKAFLQMADQAKLLDSQLKLVTSSSRELERVQKSLFVISQETRQDLESTTNLYARMARATKDLSVSEKDLLKATETVNKAMIVSGASTQEASSAITQLSQGLASGVLRGEEFNSITENGSRIARALADSLGVTIGQLRAMAAEGKLTSDVVMKSLISQSKAIGDEFNKMSVTTGQAMINVSNSMTGAISALDQATGVTDFLASSIQGFSKAIDNNIDDIQFFGIATEAIIGRMIDGFDLLQETAEFGIESLILVPQIGLQEFIAIIHEQIADLKMLANDISGSFGQDDLFSGDSISDSLYRANVALDKSSQITKELKQESQEVLEAGRNFNQTVEERILLGYSELKNAKDIKNELISTSEIEKPSTAPTQKELILTNDAHNEATVALDAYNQSLEDAREQYIAITGTQYDIWLQESSNKMRELAESGAFTNEELTKLWETLDSSKDTEMTISGLDKTYESMNDMLDLQMQLAEGALEWGSSFGSVNKGFDNIAKASKKMNLDAFRFEKADLKLQEDFAKSFLEANGDMLKEKEATEKFDADTAALTQVRQTAEIGGYAALAGAMSTAFAEGSAGAQAFQAIQATLGIVNGFTAIAGAWASAPFPANIPAVAATTAQMLPLIGQLSSLGGAGGGGGGGATVAPTAARGKDYYDDAKDTAEETNKPILAKFDRQIELLEQISGYGGTTIGLGLEKALAEYQAESTIAIIEAASQGGSSFGYGTSSAYALSLEDKVYSQIENLKDLADSFENNILATARIWETGTSYWNYVTDVAIKEETFSGAAEFIDFLEYLKENNLLETFGYTQLEYENIISDFQDVSSELAVTVLENINTLIDYSNDLEELFDTITNTTKYQTQNLQQAFSDVGDLAEDTPISEYLQNQIDAIVELENSLTKEQISLLLSSDINDYIAQQTLIQDIQKDTLATLDTGVLEALNYKDSIMLVGEAMANSAENMKSFEDSFKTQEELATDLATAVGMQLVPSFEILNRLFVTLSESGGILTDAELEFLEANKELIEESRSLIDDAVANFTSNMESMADSIDKAINTIKGGILSGDELTTDQIKRLNYTQMAFESALSSGDSDKARELIGEITSLSTGISSGAFGDTSKINQNLLSSLEANKAMIDFKDEILMVRIVASDLDYEQTVSTTTPSVYVTNSTNNDDRLATLEAIMIEVLKTNKNVYDVLLQIQNDGVKTI